MKKEEFTKLGLSEEDAKKCEKASTEELKGYATKLSYDELEIAKKQAEVSVAERDAQLEKLKNSTDNPETLKATIATLQADNKTNTEKYEGEMKQLKIDSAVAAAITGAKGLNAKAIKALLNLEKAEIGTDGTVSGLADQLKALSKADDSKFMFGTEAKPQLRGAVPGQSGNEGADKSVDFSNMPYDQLEAYMADNPNVEIN